MFVIKKEMSFLKISDPVKRDSIVKEFLELKKNIRDNLLSERTGEQQLQADLSKFYRPITETQKATAREITEGLKPIREGIEKLPEAITFPPTQALGEASGEASGEEGPLSLGEIAEEYLKDPNRDTTFGIRNVEGLYYISNKQATIVNNNILIGDEKFEGTPGLWELLMSKNPNKYNFNNNDYNEYAKLMVKTNAFHTNYNPNNPYPRSSRSDKWNLVRKIWAYREDIKKKGGYEGEGVVVIPSDPNALLERLELLLASQEAGHTGVRDELVSICDELKRQGVLDTKAYKKLNHLIKK